VVRRHRKRFTQRRALKGVFLFSRVKQEKFRAAREKNFVPVIVFAIRCGYDARSLVMCAVAQAKSREVSRLPRPG
jgi:hypothetical protein